MKKAYLSAIFALCLSFNVFANTEKLDPNNVDPIGLYEEFIDVYTENKDNLPYVFETMELLPKATQIELLNHMLQVETITDKERLLIKTQIQKLSTK